MRRAVFVLTCALVVVFGFVPANAASDPREGQIPDGAELGLDGGLGMSHPGQHGSTSGHLPPSSENVELVGKLRLTSFEGDISDVSALQTADGRWFAYVGNWGAHCPTGGVHVVDITDPANPTRAGFLNSGGFGYVTEGLQALHVDTEAFTGDILVVSNEWCQVSGNPRNMPGGITIWDITEPTEPKQLVRAFGDFDLFGDRANEAHSAIAWDTGDNVYVAAIDNDEAFDDVDIFDITDPRNPVLVSETGLFDLNVDPPVARWPAEFDAFGQEPTSHDFDVLQKPDGTWHLMVSYWDAGWVDLDVTDPANPTFIEDSTYAECDQVVEEATGECLLPEGNAHQGEWNADGSLFIGTDEDFTPTRANCSIEAAVIGCTEFGWTDLVPLTDRDPANFSGTPVFGGSGCVEDVNPANGTSDRTDVLNNLTQAQTGADAIAFVRGTCFFSDKIQTGIEAGYDMVIIINSHEASANGLIPNSFFAGGQGSPITPGVASAVMIGHANGHELFNDPPEFEVEEDIEFGAVGNTFSAEGGILDGWGYVRLLDSDPAGGFTEIDQLTIPETIDPAFNQGFGDLTVHEVEVPRGDPNEGGPAPDDGVLAYFSWYAGGFRVASFDATGIQEVGHFIDEGGNNFWGVALAEDQNGDRIVLASDRDFGLYIFRYTGPIPAP
jgi:LVIVD repeat